jgi:hypothetical protein
MVTLFEFIVLFAVFFAVNYAAYWITEVNGLPRWLQYKPWECRLCLTFWSLIAIYITIWLSFSCLYVGIGGIILASMNALAMWIDQRNKTVKIEEELFNIEVNGDEIILNKKQDK